MIGLKSTNSLKCGLMKSMKLLLTKGFMFALLNSSSRSEMAISLSVKLPTGNFARLFFKNLLNTIKHLKTGNIPTVLTSVAKTVNPAGAMVLKTPGTFNKLTNLLTKNLAKKDKGFKYIIIIG